MATGLGWLQTLKLDALNHNKIDYEAYLLWISATVRMIKRGEDVGDNADAIWLFWEEHWKHRRWDGAANRAKLDKLAGIIFKAAQKYWKNILL